MILPVNYLKRKQYIWSDFEIAGSFGKLWYKLAQTDDSGTKTRFGQRAAVNCRLKRLGPGLGFNERPYRIRMPNSFSQYLASAYLNPRQSQKPHNYAFTIRRAEIPTWLRSNREICHTVTPNDWYELCSTKKSFLLLKSDELVNNLECITFNESGVASMLIGVSSH